MSQDKTTPRTIFDHQRMQRAWLRAAGGDICRVEDALAAITSSERRLTHAAILQEIGNVR